MHVLARELGVRLGRRAVGLLLDAARLERLGGAVHAGVQNLRENAAARPDVHGGAVLRLLKHEFGGPVPFGEGGGATEKSYSLRTNGGEKE